MKYSKESLLHFQSTIQNFYKLHGRKLPWREKNNPYQILISEIMLQQTQVDRVIPKYLLFINTFPNFYSLKKAQFEDILSVWQGLGYNRRALYIKQLSEIVVNKYQNQLPKTIEELILLPGLGKATASAVLTYAYNQPHIFIETNIRSVFIHHFFIGKNDITDLEILPLVEKTLDHNNPRIWYWALMDYGTYLKKHFGNPNKKSKHYLKQSKFEGSNRQVRGLLLKYLLISKKSQIDTISKEIQQPTHIVMKNLKQLEKEGLIKKMGRSFSLPK